MKYLKLYELFKMPSESKIQDPLYLIKEIEDLKYIIEDDLAWNVDCRIDSIKHANEFISISFSYKKDGKVRRMRGTEDMLLVRSEQYQEFMDRLQDICSEVGCYLFGGHGPRYLYITNSEIDKKIVLNDLGILQSIGDYDQFKLDESFVQKDPIFSEISHLKYLLEDEGYKLYYRKGCLDKEDPLPVLKNGKFEKPRKNIIYFDPKYPEIHSDKEESHILYMINITRKSNIIILDEEERLTLSKTSEYEEFIERLREACEPYGFKVDQMGYFEESYDAIVIYKGFDKKEIKGDFWYMDDMLSDEIEEMDQYTRLLENKNFGGVEEIVNQLRYILEDEGYVLKYENCYLDSVGRVVNSSIYICLG